MDKHNLWKEQLTEENAEDVMPIGMLNRNYFRHLRIDGIAGTTSRWYPSDKPAAYQINKHQQYGPEDISYAMNSYGYRCEEFIHDMPALMFTGCSITIGLGLPLEDTWAWKLKGMVEREIDRPVRFWNVAHGGKGMDYVVRTAHLASKVVKPDFTIALLASPARIELADNGRYEGLVDVINAGDTEYLSEEERPGFLRLTSIDEFSLKTARTVAMLEALYGDNFIWDSWALYGNVLKKFNTMTDRTMLHNRFSEKILFDKKARDSLHPGAAANENFAERVFAEKGDAIVAALKDWRPR